jgi:hypothetical protein
MALKAGCQGIVLSNHGGRQLEFARSSIEVLVEVVDKFKELGLWPARNFEIYIDGGVRRATDVLKAVALGATAGTLCRYTFYNYIQLIVILTSWRGSAVLVCVFRLWARRYQQGSTNTTRRSFTVL